LTAQHYYRWTEAIETVERQLLTRAFSNGSK
jgi:hypothetical protein